MNTECYLIRHGIPELQHALMGSTDSPLSESGWQQLKNTFARLDEFDQLVSSPLKRCSAFAKKFTEEEGFQSNLAIKDNWREYHFGDWDGKTITFLQQQYPQQYEQFFTDPYNHTPPNAESLTDFSTRVEEAVKQLHNEYQGKKIVILSHAGVIRTLVAWCLKMDYRTGLQFSNFALDYASITHISIHQGSDQLYPRLIALNG